jgi:hypothetical protein
MKNYSAVITTVIGALVIGFIFFTTSGVAENAGKIAVTTQKVDSLCLDIRDIKTDIKQIMNILMERK